MDQQTDADGYTLIDLGREPTHVRLEFPSAPRKDPAGAATTAARDPDYASAWNFAEFVQQSLRRSAKDEVKQTTAIEQIDTTILLEDQP